MKNRRGNTALHDAVINSQPTEIVKILAVEFPDACYYQNNEGKSPLYLAAEHDNNMLGYLLDVIQNISNSAYKLEGSSPAIAALLKNDMVTLSTIAQRKLELLRLRNENGGNLLHFAASEGKIRGVDTLLSKIPECQFQCDNQGHYPIHTACIKGHVEIVKKLLDAFYDKSECINKKGQNILHLASDSGNWKFVESIMAESWFGKVANEQDEDGNTPLHLAAINGQCMVAFALLRHKLIKNDSLNNNRQTAYNIAWKQSETLETKFTASREEHKSKACADGSDQNQEIETSNESHVQMLTFSVLYFNTKSRPKLVNEVRIRDEPVSRKQANNSISSLLVVAGVAFAGCVTLPGNILSKKNFENLQRLYVWNDLIVSHPLLGTTILCEIDYSFCVAWIYNDLGCHLLPVPRILNCCSHSSRAKPYLVRARDLCRPLPRN
ncbi:hypothetical protein K2173_001757 [Erythroxylum novogranatense]|uniref:PGG domain-containing protein n=1 Tax=Erythroxylum novogranatense TaxID=1862640 RepID=A0AAV8S8G3_9ROSI|nr:hypothetical protein K2173_001757 [Erythroxylum novogranatense]